MKDGCGLSVTFSLLKMIYGGTAIRAAISPTLWGEVMASRNVTWSIIIESGVVAVGTKGARVKSVKNQPQVPRRWW